MTVVETSINKLFPASCSCKVPGEPVPSDLCFSISGWPVLSPCGMVEREAEPHHLTSHGELNSCFTHMLKFAFPCYQVLDSVINMKLFHCELNTNVEERKKGEVEVVKKEAHSYKESLKRALVGKSRERECAMEQERAFQSLSILLPFT